MTRDFGDCAHSDRDYMVTTRTWRRGLCWACLLALLKELDTREIVMVAREIRDPEEREP